MFGRTNIVGIGTIAIVLSGLSFGIPPWAKTNSNPLSKGKYTTVCSGTGPAMNVARQEAIESCLYSATQLLQTHIKVKAITVQTEKDAVYHQEVSNEQSYKNLNCIPKQEAIEDSGGQYKVWLMCEFDLKRADTLVSKEADKQREPASSARLIENEDELSQQRAKSASLHEGRYITGDRKTLTIATIPQCSTLLVRGKMTRIVQCTSNPITVVIQPGDLEIIVRADAYLPKTIKLSREILRDDDVQVLLEPQN